VWTCVEAAENGHLHVLLWALQNNCPLPTQPIIIQSHQKCFFISTKKLLKHNSNSLRFEDKPLIEAWIQIIDNLCSDLFYNDLSLLIKNFI
jgi:hypothetical protein